MKGYFSKGNLFHKAKKVTFFVSADMVVVVDVEVFVVVVVVDVVVVLLWMLKLLFLLWMLKWLVVVVLDVEVVVVVELYDKKSNIFLLYKKGYLLKSNLFCLFCSRVAENKFNKRLLFKR